MAAGYARAAAGSASFPLRMSAPDSTSTPATAAPQAQPVAPHALAGAAAPRTAGLTPTDALLALMSLIWAVNFIVAKAAFVHFPPIQFNALRFVIAGTVMLAIAWRYGQGLPRREDWWRFLGIGILGNTIYQVAFIEGLAHTRAGNASLIMGGVPMATAILSHLHGHERLRGRDLTGLGVSSAGLAVIVLGSGHEAGLRASLSGDLLVAFATFCWALYTVLSKPLIDRYGTVTTTALTMAIGAVPIVLLGAPSLLARDLGSVPAAGWGGVVYSALFALVVAFLLWYHGVNKLGSTRTAVYSNITPVLTVLIAWPLLSEVPTLWQVSGGVGIFAGIYLTRS